ncbi:MAG TPA: hypothetical protein PLC98_10805 [Anaerolineales bacterium]|nr:hypothetical protein [Anaerolineales bacterium]
MMPKTRIVPMHVRHLPFLLLVVALAGAGCRAPASDPTRAPASDPTVIAGGGMPTPTPGADLEAGSTESVDAEDDPVLARSFVFSPPEGFELERSERTLLGGGYVEYLAADLPARLFFATGLAEFEYAGFPDKPWITSEEDWRVAAPPRDVALGSGVEVKVYRYRRVLSGRTEFVQWVFGFDGQDGIVRGAILSTSTVFTDADVREVLAAIR